MVVNKTNYIIDTGILIKYLRADRRAIHLLNSISSNSSISVMTITELLLGCKSAAEAEYTKKFLQQFILQPITSITAEIAANIIRQNPDYFGTKADRGVVDAYLAATAIEKKLQFITLNRKHFQKLKHPDFTCIILKETDTQWKLIQ